MSNNERSVVKVYGAQDLKRSANKKYYRENFAGKDLSTADFRNASVLECDFTGATLRYANFENANCYGANFTDADMYRTNMKDAILASSIMCPKDCFGMTITLTCDTVQKMKVNDKILNYWLYMALMMDGPPEQMLLLRASIGEEKVASLERMFKERMF